MVRGIYQTSEASRSQVNWMAAGTAIVVVLIGIALLFKVINDVGGSYCNMAYYTSDDSAMTYKDFAERAMSRAGYSWESLKDRGDFPKSSADCNPKIRKFTAKGLVKPGGRSVGTATVAVRFDSWSQTWAVTTVHSVTPSDS